MTIQGPITFQDVAASFTEEQWACLEDWRKEIYKTVVKEIHEAITSLGYTIVNPSVVFNVKKRDESCVRFDSQSVEQCTGAGDFPDISLKVKAEPAEVLCVLEKPQTIAQPCTSDSAVTSSSPSFVIEENTAHGQMHISSHPKKSSICPIKTEEEACSIDQCNNGGDKSPCPTKGDGLIKHESEEETDNEEDSQAVESNPASDGVQQAVVCERSRADRNGEDKQSRADSTSLETEPKRRKTCSQVRGDILSLQEREARRLRVLQGLVKPFQAQPNATFAYILPQVKKEQTDLPLPRVRRDLLSTSWCRCGQCSVMSNSDESLCCHEISGLLPQLNEEHLCITKHPAFKELCLDKDRLDFLYRFLARIKRKNDVLYYLHKLRRTSYRAFVIWAHGFLDFRKHKPVPACVVRRVQEFLPYPAELNVGYMKMYDYPAALMALDHI